MPEGHLSAIRAASRPYFCVCCFKGICLCVSNTSCLKAISFQILYLHLHLHVLLLLLYSAHAPLRLSVCSYSYTYRVVTV